ncbi:MAG: YfhO family protein [Armatimonadetes bacterium]|nr:YfhO family protein [Armatimonadota bacterium]
MIPADRPLMQSDPSPRPATDAPCHPAPPPPRAGLARLWAPAALLAAVLLLFWEPLFGNRMLYYGDLLLYYYPHYSFITSAIQQGTIPLWNPHLFSGIPVLGHPLIGLAYPPNLIYLVLPVDRATAWSLAAHVFATGWWTFLFAREQGCSRPAAAVAGLAFMLSGPVIAQTPKVAQLHTFPWIPLIMLFAHRALVTGRRENYLWLAGALAMQILAASPQTVVITGVAIAGYAIVVAAHRPGARQVLRRLAAIGGSAAAAAVIAAIYLIPVAVLARQSVRLGFVPGSIFTFRLEWPHVLSILVPNLFGNPEVVYWGAWNYHEMAGYVGAATLALAATAVAGRDRWAVGMGIMAAAALVLALGDNTPVYPAAVRIFPVLGLFRVPARFLIISTFAVATVAARGLDHLLGAEGRRPAHTAMGAAGVLAAACLLTRVGGPGAPASVHEAVAKILPFLALQRLAGQVTAAASAVVWMSVLTSAAVLLALLLLVAAHARGRLTRQALAAGVVAITAADLLLFARPLNPTAPRIPLREPAPVESVLLEGPPGQRLGPLEEALQNERHRTLGFIHNFGPPGGAYIAAARNLLVPNVSLMVGASSTVGLEGVILTSYDRYLSAVLEELRVAPTSKLLDFLGARYMASLAPLPPPYRIRYRTSSITISENPHALPHGYLVTRVVVTDRGNVLPVMRSRAFDPRTTVVLEEVPQKPAGPPVPGAAPRAVEQVSSPNRVVFRVRSPGPAILVVSDPYYPGWTATVDGRETRILRANYAFRAVSVPSGEHEVVFTYRPRGLWAALAISALGAAVWTGLALRVWTRRRRRREA